MEERAVRDRVLGGAALVGALAVLAAPARAAAPAGPWDAFNLAPASRTVAPAGVYTPGGACQQRRRRDHRSPPART